MAHYHASITAAVDPLSWTEADATNDDKPMSIRLMFDPQAWTTADANDPAVWTQLEHHATNTTPMTVYLGLWQAWTLPTAVDAAAVAALLQSPEWTALFDAIADGYSTEWDGSTVVGRYNADARRALDHITETMIDQLPLRDDDSGIYDARDWLTADEVVSEYAVTADADDDDLYRIATEIDFEARRQSIILTHTYDYLRTLRNDRADAAALHP